MEATNEEKRQLVKDSLLAVGPVEAELADSSKVVILEAMDDWFVVDGGQHFPYDQIAEVHEHPGDR
jgi:hypothetical protein